MKPQGTDRQTDQQDAAGKASAPANDRPNPANSKVNVKQNACTKHHQRMHANNLSGDCLIKLTAACKDCSCFDKHHALLSDCMCTKSQAVSAIIVQVGLLHATKLPQPSEIVANGLVFICPADKSMDVQAQAGGKPANESREAEAA